MLLINNALRDKAGQAVLNLLTTDRSSGQWILSIGNDGFDPYDTERFSDLNVYFKDVMVRAGGDGWFLNKPLMRAFWDTQTSFHISDQHMLSYWSYANGVLTFNAADCFNRIAIDQVQLPHNRRFFALTYIPYADTGSSYLERRNGTPNWLFDYRYNHLDSAYEAFSVLGSVGSRTSGADITLEHVDQTNMDYRFVGELTFKLPNAVGVPDTPEKAERTSITDIMDFSRITATAGTFYKEIDTVNNVLIGNNHWQSVEFFTDELPLGKYYLELEMPHDENLEYFPYTVLNNGVYDFDPQSLGGYLNYVQAGFQDSRQAVRTLSGVDGRIVFNDDPRSSFVLDSYPSARFLRIYIDTHSAKWRLEAYTSLSTPTMYTSMERKITYAGATFAIFAHYSRNIAIKFNFTRASMRKRIPDGYKPLSMAY